MKRLFIILLSVLCLNSFATTYYVKSVANGGSDAANGLTDGTAWATVNKVNTTIASGDIVYFNRGDTWREIIIPVNGSAGNYTYYGAYGAGAKPLFLGSTNLMTGWTDLGGNIWRNKNAIFSVDCGNLIFNNEASCGTKLMTDTTVINAQGKFFWSNTGKYVKLYSVGDPGTFYTKIECAMKYNAITMSGKQYCTFQNLDFRYWGKHGCESGGNYINFLDCDLSYIGGCDQLNNYATRYGNGIQIWEGQHDWTITRCHITNCYDAGITPQGYNGSFTVYNLYMYDNIVSKCEYGFEFFERDGTAAAHDIYFEHNDIINSGGGWGHLQRPDGVNGSAVRMVLFTAVKTNIFIRYNIFYGTTERFYYIAATSDLTNITLDYNSYYSSTGVVGRVNTTNYAALSDWKTITSQEVNSNGSDPLFVSSADFRLQSGSPIKASGIAGIVTTDFLNYLFANPPSIGAYQYFAAGIPTVKAYRYNGKTVRYNGKTVKL